MLGASGMTNATAVAMLNANYIKARLEAHYPVLYAGARGRVAHELIFDLRPFKAETGISVYELPPGQAVCPYHYECGEEEWLLVLSGTPTLRTPAGEERLAPWDVACFPRGPEGAHQLSNRSEAVVRYVLAASQGSPEIIEYPDSGKIAAMSRTETSAGGPLFTVNRLEDAVDYYDGESV